MLNKGLLSTAAGGGGGNFILFGCGATGGFKGFSSWGFCDFSYGFFGYTISEFKRFIAFSILLEAADLEILEERVHFSSLICDFSGFLVVFLAAFSSLSFWSKLCFVYCGGFSGFSVSGSFLGAGVASLTQVLAFLDTICFLPGDTD